MFYIYWFVAVYVYWFLHVSNHVFSWSSLTKYVENAAADNVIHCVENATADKIMH